MKIKPVAAASTSQEPSISPSPKNSTKNFDASFVQTFRDCAVPETRATFGGLECRFTNHCRLNEEQKRLVQAAIDKVNASLFSTTPQSSHF